MVSESMDPGAQGRPNPRSAFITHLAKSKLHKLCLSEFPHLQNGFQNSAHVFFWGDEHILKLDRAVVTSHCQYTKCH